MSRGVYSRLRGESEEEDAHYGRKKHALCFRPGESGVIMRDVYDGKPPPAGGAEWRLMAAETRSSSAEKVRRRNQPSSSGPQEDPRSPSQSPSVSPSSSLALDKGWRSEKVLLKEDEADTAVHTGFSPNVLLPAPSSPSPAGAVSGDLTRPVFVAPPPARTTGGTRISEVMIPLPPGGDMPIIGSDDSLDDCHEWGVEGETAKDDDEHESAEEDEGDETVVFWRRMPAGDRLRWAAGRVFRIDTHSVLALPIFFFIVSILVVEVFFYICVRLLIVLTEAVFFYLASLAYWFRSVFLRRLFAAGTPAGKEVNKAAAEAAQRAAVVAESAALEFTGLGVGASEAPAAAALRVAPGGRARALFGAPASSGIARGSPRGEDELAEMRPRSTAAQFFRLASAPFTLPFQAGWEACQRCRRRSRKLWRGADRASSSNGPEFASSGTPHSAGVAHAEEDSGVSGKSARGEGEWGGSTHTGSGSQEGGHNTPAAGDVCSRGRAQEKGAGVAEALGSDRRRRLSDDDGDTPGFQRQWSLAPEAAEDQSGESLMSHRTKLFKSKTYQEYARLAITMDKITGREKWKHELETSMYDYETVAKRLQILRKARQSGKLAALQEALRGSLRDQMFGVFKERLYSRTYLGTKVQAEEFIDEVCLCLKELKRHSHRRPEEVRRIFHQLQTSWGVTGLILSGGASLGLHHFGVLEVLLKARAEGRCLLPRVVGGCSAGAVVAAWLCTRTDDELLQQGTVEYLVEHWKALSPNSWLLRLWNVLTKGYMCDIDVWKASAKKLFGDLTFLEAYQRTGRVLNISMTRADREESGVQVMNYVNAPNVLIWSALLCSCAFPFLSLPLPLREKSPKGKAVISKVFGCSYFHDGSLSGDIPTEQMREAWAVSYSIVSQVNLHVFPFAGLRTHGEAGIPVHWRGRSSRWRAGFLLSALELFFKEHIRFLLRLIALLDVSPTLRGINAGSLALQSYTGDVTLHPRYISARYWRLLNDTSPSDISWYLQEGRLMVFPKLHLIRNRMRVDRCFEDLAAAVDSSSASFPATAPRRGVQKAC